MRRVLQAEEVGGERRLRRLPAAAWQAGERAAALLAAAEAEVAARRGEAEQALQGLREEAVREGFAEGLARAAATRLEAEGRRDAALAAAADEALDLAVEMARRLLGRELALDPAAVRGVAAAALAAARGRRRAVLRLHPAARAALGPEADRLAALAGLPGLELVEDPSLEPGDALVETEAGRVDGRLRVRLEAFRRALGEAT